MSEGDFEALVKGMELEIPDDVVDVTTLTFGELCSRLEDIRTELYSRDEMVDPSTPRGRELHSLRLALFTERQTRTREGRR